MYTLLPKTSADFSFSSAALYAEPDVPLSLDFSDSGLSLIYLGATALTGVYLGATPVQVYFGSTQVFG